VHLTGALPLSAKKLFSRRLRLGVRWVEIAAEQSKARGATA